MLEVAGKIINTTYNFISRQVGAKQNQNIFMKFLIQLESTCNGSRMMLIKVPAHQMI